MDTDISCMSIQKEGLHHRKHYFSIILVLLMQCLNFSYHNGGYRTSGFTRNMDAVHPSDSTLCWICVQSTIVCVSANAGNIISCLTVVFMLIPQYTILSSIYPGHRNWIEVVGVVLVLLGSSLGSVLELNQCKTI